MEGSSFTGNAASDNARVFMGTASGGVQMNTYNYHSNAGITLSGSGYSNKPLQPVAYYVQRPELHNIIKCQLHDTLSESSGGARRMIVYGLGGSGKSQLVLDYIRTFRGDYNGVFWIEAGEKATLERDFLNIYATLFATSSSAGSIQVSVDHAVRAVKQWFNGRDGKYLLVFDSADDIDNDKDDSYIDLLSYLPDAASVNIIITTRSGTAQHMTVLQSVHVEELERSEAFDLFRRCSKVVGRDEDVLDIVKELGNFALAITLARAYVAATPRLRSNLAQYLPEYRQRRRELLSQRPRRHIHHYGESVLTTWESSFSAVAKEKPEAARLLCLLAFLSADDIFMALFEAHNRQAYQQPAWYDHTHDWTSTIFGTEEYNKYTLQEAFGVLQTFSLIRWQDNRSSYSMHKLVHEWAYERLPENEKATFNNAAMKLVLAMAGELVELERPDHALSARLVPHIVASSTLCMQRRAQGRTVIEVSIALLNGLARFLDDLGHFLASSHMLKFVLTEYRGIREPDHHLTIEVGYALGRSYQAQGRFNEAAKLYEEAITVSRTKYGSDDNRIMDFETSLASVYDGLGRHREAGMMCKSLYEKQKTGLGLQDRRTQETMMVMSRSYIDQGRLEDARIIVEEALNAMSTEPDYLHLQAWTSLEYIYARQGRTDQAEALSKRAVALLMTNIGLKYPEMLKWGVYRSEISRLQGRLDEAEELIQQTILRMKRVLGEENPGFLEAQKTHAQIWKAQSRHQEAIELLDECAASYKAKLGPEHPETRSAFDLLENWKRE
jgi:tetratricopeptide (TPR) repeat protein